MKTYDLVVIGSGTAAQVASAQLRKTGRTVAVVDHRPFGGTCALRGCDPNSAQSNRKGFADDDVRVSDRCIRHRIYGLGRFAGQHPEYRAPGSRG